MAKRHQVVVWVCGAAAVIFLAACGYGFSLVQVPAPTIPLPQQFQWHSDGNAYTSIAVPMSDKTPGPTTLVKMQHETGYAAPIRDSDAFDQAAASGQVVLAALVSKLKATGWQPLFSPTVTSSYPQYVLYITLQANGHYCFVEYSANALTDHVASRQLEVFHS